MLRISGLLLSILLLSCPAHALLGSACVDANSIASPWAGVGAITIAGGGTYSGALIGPRQVLTAAHVVSGRQATPGDITFNLNYGGDTTIRIPAAAVHIFPAYQGTRPGRNGFWHDDIAVLELAAAVPEGVPIYPLFQGIPGIDGTHRDLMFVGYGAGGTRPADPRIKRVGRNALDQLVPNQGRDNGFDLFVFGFEPDASAGADCSDPAGAFAQTAESLFAGGDSGSPVFVEDHGVWKIAGVATFASPPPRSRTQAQAAIGGGTLVTPYATWIERQLAQGAAADSASLPLRVMAVLLFLALALGAGLRLARHRRRRQVA